MSHVVDESSGRLAGHCSRSPANANCGHHVVGPTLP